MIRTNYYAIRINQFLKNRYTFMLTTTIMLYALVYKLITPLRTLNEINYVLDLKYGTVLKFHANSEQLLYIKVFIYGVLYVGLLAISNNFYERFLYNKFMRKKVVKWYDVKEVKYPYDPTKLQLILGVVHNEDSNLLSLKPFYQKIVGNGLFQNILITGTIGTGKTACAIVQISLQLIYLFCNDSKNKCSMLFLDVKGTFYQFVYAFAKECGRWDDIITIELGGKIKYNPLHKPNLTEIELANRIRYILELFSSGGGSESYWIDKAEATICELIKLIRIYNNGYVNFEELHKMGTKEEYRDKKINMILSWIKNSEEDPNSRQINEEQKYNYFTAVSFFKDEYDRLDEKGQGYIKSEITRMTSPFISTKTVKDTFVPSKEEINFDGFEDVIRKGKIVVWKINANKEPKVAKLIAAYLKIDYQKEIMITLENKNTKEGSILANRIKVTVCDEYQEYCTRNDPDFFAQSREPRSITIAATQSYSSLKKALQNDETMTSVLLQSFVNKIWLRSDDVDYTIKKVIAQISKVDREKVSTSTTESTNNTDFNNTLGQVVSSKKNISSSENISSQKEDKFDVKFLSHDLSMGQSVCFLSDGNNIIPPTVVHLTKFFEGRILYENGKIEFVTDKDKIFKMINEAGTVNFDDIENTLLTNNESTITFDIPEMPNSNDKLTEDNSSQDQGDEQASIMNETDIVLGTSEDVISFLIDDNEENIEETFTDLDEQVAEMEVEKKIDLSDEEKSELLRDF